MSFLQKHIEALIFCAAEPITPEEIRLCLAEMFEADVPIEDITLSIEQLKEKYQHEDYVFELSGSAGGLQFLTKPAYQTSISILLKHKSKRKLSTSAIETLSIVAYKQPVSKPEIEQIRGVNCDYAIQKLLEKELIEIRGKADSVGRPMLYGTTPRFMDYFGINSLNELPQPKDFSEEDQNLGIAHSQAFTEEP